MQGINLGKNEKESEINLVAIYNNGKIWVAVEGLRSIVENWQRKEDNIPLIGDFNARVVKGQIGREGEKIK